ncbi:MAG: hypothetical protein AAF517_11335 [Planctomycetota bacterium]
MPTIDQDRIRATLDRDSEPRDAGPSDAEILDAARRPAVRGLDAQALWAIVSFLRQERRQEWVRHIIVDKLKRDVVQLGRRGWLAIGEWSDSKGEVPGEPGWRYDFHGCGCLLTHEDGTQLDVDFTREGAADEIDSYFYKWFLTTSPALSWCERQLRKPECMDEAWLFDVARLKSLGYLEVPRRFKFTEAGREFAQRAEPLAEAIDELGDRPRMRAVLLCLAGDVRAALSSAEFSPALEDELRAIGEAQVAERHGRVLGALKTATSLERAHFLQALAALGPDRARRTLERELNRRPVDSGHRAALEVLASWDEERSDERTAKVFWRTLRRHHRRPLTGWVLRRLKLQKGWADESRGSLVLSLCREILARRTSFGAIGVDVDWIQQVLRKQARKPEAASLLYILDRDEGLERLRENLSQSTPLVVEESAAFLALAGANDKDCLEALFEQARGDPRRGGFAAASVLRHLDDQRATEAAQECEQRYDALRASEESAGGERDWNYWDRTRKNASALVALTMENVRRDFAHLLELWRS